MSKDLIYEHDEDVASFPYHFELVKEEGEKCTGTVTALIWKDLKINEEEGKKLQEKLDTIPHQINSGFYLREGKIIYTSFVTYDKPIRNRDAEIDVRRHFIEDYLEAERDLTAYVKPYDAVTCKTEFLN
jgi:hypothetical protein